MRVKLKYVDTTSIAPSEIKAQAKALYGDSVTVEVTADSDDVYNLLYFAIQEHVTVRQLNSFYDDGPLYETKIEQLRKEVAGLVEEAFSQLITDNEEKLT